MIFILFRRRRSDILLGSLYYFLFCVPLKIYENAYTQEAQILKENKGKSGPNIYILYIFDLYILYKIIPMNKSFFTLLYFTLPKMVKDTLVLQ
jgi:hypothetical protein